MINIKVAKQISEEFKKISFNNNFSSDNYEKAYNNIYVKFLKNNYIDYNQFCQKFDNIEKEKYYEISAKLLFYYIEVRLLTEKDDLNFKSVHTIVHKTYLFQLNDKMSMIAEEKYKKMINELMQITSQSVSYVGKILDINKMIKVHSPIFYKRISTDMDLDSWWEK